MHLYVSTGIAGVNNLRFCPSFSTIMWDPPQTFGVFSNLSYLLKLTATNMNTGVVIIETTSTTTETSYTIKATQPCTNYSASVTAFSSEFTGISVSITDSSPGGESWLDFMYIVFPTLITH